MPNKQTKSKGRKTGSGFAAFLYGLGSVKVCRLPDNARQMTGVFKVWRVRHAPRSAMIGAVSFESAYRDECPAPSRYRFAGCSVSVAAVK
ncbi:hypothetical protein RC983_000278 [Neisseria gonorrhoeae]|uniref:hypothetical protein n=1 Tax=Neisseria lactamica TaxID=486 RepID=UPI0018654935|nr:hypothetical protein [Neisseria lactamica]